MSNHRCPSATMSMRMGRRRSAASGTASRGRHDAGARSSSSGKVCLALPLEMAGVPATQTPDRALAIGDEMVVRQAPEAKAESPSLEGDGQPGFLLGRRSRPLLLLRPGAAPITNLLPHLRLIPWRSGSTWRSSGCGRPRELSWGRRRPGLAERLGRIGRGGTENSNLRGHHGRSSFGQGGRGSRGRVGRALSSRGEHSPIPHRSHRRGGDQVGIGVGVGPSIPGQAGRRGRVGGGGRGGGVGWGGHGLGLERGSRPEAAMRGDSGGRQGSRGSWLDVRNYFFL